MNVQDAIQLLKQNGLKMTSRRKGMLRYFEGEDGYRTAKDVMSHMEEIHEGMSFDTVYRNLHLYHSLGILESTDLDGEKHFRMNCMSDHHHHFICKDCGNTKKIPICPMDEIEQLLKNYDIEDHKLEVYGVCPLCKSA